MGYDWKKTGLKFGKSAIYVIIAGLAAVYGDNNYYLAIAPIIHAAENYIKHNDTFN